MTKKKKKPARRKKVDQEFAHDLTIISIKMLSIQVCTDYKNPKLIEGEANAQHPSGVRSPWALSKQKEHKPCVCDEDKTRKHYILSC